MDSNNYMNKISNSAKRVNNFQAALDEMRSESGFDRVKAIAKMLIGANS